MSIGTQEDERRGRGRHIARRLGLRADHRFDSKDLALLPFTRS